MKKARPHRTHELRAKSAALRFIKTQEHLDELLRQFSPAHHAGIIERLRPHLKFEPKAFKEKTP